ncbi:MAG: ribosome maturation factor RimP [Acidobacteria bacterium]|nr:ribosome maturation factor RimP [Acidobacteriota bacterium]
MSANSKTAVVDKIRAIADRVGGSEGIEIVDLQLLGGGRARTLRMFIDKPGGVTHEDCQNISHQVGTILDVEDVVPGGSYTLEVSSPGVERKLQTPRDFERVVGQKVKVSLREPVENQKYWEGILSGCADGILSVDPAPGRSIRIQLEQVERANLKFEW